MFRLERIRCSIQLGRYGMASSGIDAWAGLRPPLRELQAKQAATTFSQVSTPPRDTGWTWSRVSFWRGNACPQYMHRCWSRAKSALLVSAGVGSSARALAWPRAATMGWSSTTLRAPVARLVPPRTARQGSPRVQATAPRTYRQVASCQLIQSSARPWASRASRRTRPRAGTPMPADCGVAGGAGGSMPLTRRSRALPGSMGTAVYTLPMTACVGAGSGTEMIGLERHQRPGAGADRGGVGQGARQDAGEVEAGGFALRLLESGRPRRIACRHGRAQPPVRQDHVARIEQVVPG